MFTTFCKKADQQPKTFQYKTKTINDNGNIKTYEWDFDKNVWNLVNSSTNEPTPKKVEELCKEEKPMSFDTLADVYAYLDNEMKKDKKGEKEFEDWKKKTKEEYVAPECEVTDFDDVEDLLELGNGVFRDVDREHYVMINSFKDYIMDGFTDLTFNNSTDDSNTVGVTDLQLLTILLDRFQGSPLESPIVDLIKAVTC